MFNRGYYHLFYATFLCEWVPVVMWQKLWGDFPVSANGPNPNLQLLTLRPNSCDLFSSQDDPRMARDCESINRGDFDASIP